MGAYVSGEDGWKSLDSGYYWEADTDGITKLTYTFNAITEEESAFGVEIFNDNQQDITELAFQQFANVANITFTNNESSNIGDVDIRFFGANFDGGAAFFPGSAYNAVVIGFASAYRVDPFSLIMHEIGHTVGLAHTHDNAGTTAGILDNFEDSVNASVMSYLNSSIAKEGGDVVKRVGEFSAKTLMIYDIKALHEAYGANYSYNNAIANGSGFYTDYTGGITDAATGNTTYAYNGENAWVGTLWDGGGNDTLDSSGYSFGATLDLRAGLKNVSHIGDTHIWVAYDANIENAVAGAGNDKLYGNDLNNVLSGGAGNDSLFGGVGFDTLNGGVGNDILYGDDEDDRLFGNEGDDKLYGGNGRDFLVGGTGNDTVNGESNNDTIYGEDGNDLLLGDGGNDILYGGIGNDILSGGVGFDTLNGGVGNDLLDGGDSDDRLYGGADQDLLFGGNGRDFLVGGAGDDLVYGESNNDTIYGEGGVDQLLGDSGNDYINGGDNNDDIYGGKNNDTLIGASGDDLLFGDDGNDILDGGIGNDILYGGAGADIFIFGPGSGLDQIIDLFSDDILQISSSIYATVADVLANTFFQEANASNALGFSYIDLGDNNMIHIMNGSENSLIISNIEII